MNRNPCSIAVLTTTLSTLAASAIGGNVDTPTDESFQSIAVSGIHAQTEFGALNAQGVISVRSDGAKYTSVVESKVTYFVTGRAEVSKNKWRIFRAVAGIGGLNVDSGVPSGPAQNFGSYHAVGVNEMPVKKLSFSNTAVEVPLGSSGLGEFAIARCNANRKGLSNQGVSAIAIFAEDREITIPVALHLAAQAHDKDFGQHGPLAQGQEIPGPAEGYWRQATIWQNMAVRCLKTPDLDLATKQDATPVPLGPQTLKQRVGVTQAFVTILPDAYQGNCPAPLNLSVAIATNGPTIVKYRIEHTDGTLPPIASVNVDQTNTALFSIPLKIGKNPTSAIGGIAGTESVPGPGIAKTFAAQPGGFQGAYRLRIVAPNVLESNYSSYQVTCKAPLGASDTYATQKPGPGGASPMLPSAKTMMTMPASPLPNHVTIPPASTTPKKRIAP